MSQHPHSQQNSTAVRLPKALFVLCAVLAFAGAACGIVWYNLRTAGSLYLQSDDGDLYLSIARNVLQNAHFIQTARPIEAFVVPPGLPAVSTLLLFLTGGLSRFLVGAGFCAHWIGSADADLLGLLGVQYAVYGIAAALMALTALRLALSGIKAGAPSRRGFLWCLSVFIGAATPIFSVWCSVRIRHPNPGFVLTENYVVCLIALVLWLSIGQPYRKADPRRVTVAAFALTLFRPACSPLFLLALGWTLIRAVRRKPSDAVRVRLYDLFVMLVAFAVAIGVNTGVNVLETGEIIPLEDYGNLDVYLANNEKAPADWYHSGKVPEFANERYEQITGSDRLTRYEQNELAGEALREYVRANPETVLRNAVIRFEKLFCETWGPVFYAFLMCLVLQMVLKGLRWPQKVFLALSAVLLSVPPAFGLLVARYSAPMLPLFISLTLGTAGQLAAMAAARQKKSKVPAAQQR